MEVKAILDKIRQKEEKKQEYFFALQLNEGIVKSAIWTVEKEAVKILAIGENRRWENEEEILGAVDASISSATEKLVSIDKGEEPNKVIFGLASDWVEGSKILPLKLELLKKVSGALEIFPVGFVVIPEAIIHNLKTNEGVPPTAILVGQAIKRTAVTLVRLGKIVGVQMVNRSDNFGDDLAEGLSRFTDEESFPPRIILYDAGEGLEEQKEELMNYPWGEKRVNFLHLPKIEILAADFDIQSVALAGGREIAKAQRLEISPREKEEKKEPEEEKMGFVFDKDITKEVPLPPVKEEIGVKEPSEIAPSRKGFKIAKINLAAIFSSFVRIKNRFPSINLKFSFGLFHSRLSLILAAVGGLLLVFGGLATALWWYLPKAEIILRVKPQALEKNFTVKLNPVLPSSDKKELILSAQKIEITSESEKTVETTGTKLLGEQAKGEVAIYNGTASQKTFLAGTIITSASGIKFTLDGDAVVASQSGTAAEPIPGKITAKVTAAEIGTEGNFSAGTEFSIANFAKSDFVAKNEATLTGGTSREVQVVSKKDQEKALEELTVELKNKALEELKNKVSPDLKLIEESLVAKVSEKSFDKNIDEEATKVKLKLKIDFSALTFKDGEFKNLVKEKIQQLVPTGFEYKSEEGEISFKIESVSKDEVVTTTAHFKAQLMPVFDLEKMKKDLAGKYLSLASQYLESLPNIEGSEIRIKSPLPRRLATLPHLVKNIKIELETE